MVTSITFYFVMFKVVAAFSSFHGEFDGAFEIGSGLHQYPCPEAEAIIFAGVHLAVSRDPRMAASLLRLHFHDCFVNGCDASVLLDDSEDFVGEKSAAPNVNSLRGFEVIDAIKREVEYVCPETVSCADILAMAARDSVVLSGGPSWEVEMGRKDSLRADKEAATNNIPSPNSTVSNIVVKFQNLGLTLRDMVALSGAHTIGKARCSSFESRLKESSSRTSDGGLEGFRETLKMLCLESDGEEARGNLDLTTPAAFDNQYYLNLVYGEGLLESDQAMVSQNDETRAIVESYAQDSVAFFDDFKIGMLKMGSLRRRTGEEGEIRRKCGTIN